MQYKYKLLLFVQIRKRGKDPKVKPILLNKEDPSCVSDPSSLPPTVTVSNRFEEMHPKDEFELLQSSLTTEKVSPPTNPSPKVGLSLHVFVCIILKVFH